MGRHSRTRLALLALTFMLGGVGFFHAAPHTPLIDSPGTSMIASADNHNCQDSLSGIQDPPCQFPAEAGIGGIILGTTSLSGEDLASWLSTNGGNDGNDVICHNDAGVDCVYSTTAPGRVDAQEPVAVVGMNQLQTTNFFSYKSWNDVHHATGTQFHTYFWMAADVADLKGTSACGAPSGGDGSIATGLARCDLMTWVGEMSVKDFSASGSTTLSISINLNANDYWLSRPEYDQCAVDIWDTSATCLGMLESASGGQDKLSDVSVSMNGLLLRVHRAAAQPDDVTTSPPTSKELDLQDVYMSVRIGKGTDMAYIPRNPSFPAVGEPLLTQGQAGPQDRKIRFSNNYDCEGNPMGTGYQACGIPANRVGVVGTQYEDVHR